MKTAVAITALLASTAVAQPHHGRHVHQKKDLHKREYETTWVTETMTATLYIDEYGTSLYEPSPGQFYPSTTSEETTSTSTSTTSKLSEPTTPEPEPTTSTSIYVEQEPTPTPEVENTPTPTPEVPVYTPTTAAAAEPTSGTGSGGSYAGDITYYDIGLGACGVDSSGTTPSGASAGDPAVVALAASWFTAGNSNNDPVCGKLIKITCGDKTGYGRVLDRCVGCAYGDIDVNPAAFSGFYALSEGRKPVSWEFV